MKFLCDACERLVEPAGFRTEGPQLALVCPKCGSESRLAGAATSASPAERPVVVPFAPRPLRVATEPNAMPVEAARPVDAAHPIAAGERCPKCAAPKQGREACAKCGLIFELYRPEIDAVPSSARRDFDELLQKWGAPATAKVLEQVSHERLLHLARLSRHHLADFPGDARAAALLEQLTSRSLALASATAQSEAIGRSLPSDRTVKIALVVLGVGVVVAILTMLASVLHKLG